ncbi:hypothetical protein EVG20_g7997 [Dentipellis fragilis]|uniref:Uncharacterized protein n=1 Tax=Dentipellis fragilis TaxID=205917 RepID=A0A4Y9YDA3_9AGAM|nr:hypothetical protein EVG20_g7997 [Dentipellis fragilis]
MNLCRRSSRNLYTVSKMDPTKLATAFQHFLDDLSPTTTISFGSSTPSELLSSTERLTVSGPVLFVVTEALSKIYYLGLPSCPRLIATTNPYHYEGPAGFEVHPTLKQLQELGEHALASAWDHGLSDGLRRGLNTMGVNWTSIDAVRIAKAGESSDLAIVWIGVEPGALSFEEGSAVAYQCRTFSDRYGIRDFHVEIRESRVVRQASNRFLDPVPSSDATFAAAREPFTALLGIPLSAKCTPWAEGTGGFYLSTGDDDDKDIYLVTVRHAILPVDEDDNKEYERTARKVRQDVVVLGTSGFNEKLHAIDSSIQIQDSAMTKAKKRIRSTEGLDDPMCIEERMDAEHDLRKAETVFKALKALRHEIATQWGTKETRVIGELAWAPPIAFSTEPGQYTLDLAIIKIDADKLDATNYHGNSIGLGTKYTPSQFLDKIDLHPAYPAPLEFPINHIVTLQDQVPESALAKPPMLDANYTRCMPVFKNGAKTGTTIGRANRVSSYTRNFFAGQYHESREWPVIPTDEFLHPIGREKYSGPFSAEGDSGSCVADVCSRVGGIITGGAYDPNTTDSADVTYFTPISFIMKVLHGTKRFEHAHLNPVLT